MKPDGITEADLIYEDDEISVLWHEGQSAELLITFGDLVTLAEGRRFSAETPVRKLGLNCIGFMGKNANWYPADSMAKAFERVLPYLTKFDERISYGGSMGGYAALKYSGLLGAGHAIALCPQWSLDAEECQGFHPGWAEWFRPEMRGMGIRSSDMAGKAYVFFDPLEFKESVHARQIGKACEETRFIWVPFVEHHVTAAMAGTETLRVLINACRRDDIQALRRLSRQQRRANWLYQEKLAARFIAHAPRAAFRHMCTQPPIFFGVAPLSTRNLVRLAEELAALGDRDESLTCMKLASNHIQSPVHKAVLIDIEATLAGMPAHLLSCHGTMLAYDIGTGQCALAAPTDSHGFSGPIPLRLIVRGSKANLCVRTSFAEIFLGLLPDGRLSAEAQEAADFDLLPAGEGKFHLRHQGNFVCADPMEAALICNRPTASHWESFHFGTRERAS